MEQHKEQHGEQDREKEADGGRSGQLPLEPNQLSSKSHVFWDTL